ncbi:MAG: NfeD family protein [Halobacteriota archaeon]|nr:NfeD family protein [Halobacteriota archaeon]
MSLFAWLVVASLLIATTIFEIIWHIILKSECATPTGISGLVGKRVVALTDLNPNGKVLVKGKTLGVLETIYNPPSRDLEDTSFVPFSFWGGLASSEPGAFGRRVIGVDWSAKTQGETIRDGERVEIIGIDGLSLIVRHE